MKCSCLTNVCVVVVLAVTAFCVGCSATSGGAAIATVGGATGAPCSVEAYNEGCNTVAGPPLQHNRMVCTAGAAGAGATWQIKATCASTEYCIEKADPAAAGTAKKITECAALPVYTADTISGGNDVTTGSDTTMSTTQILACIQQKCQALWGQCAVKPACKVIADCIAKCPASDDKCPQTCMGTTDMTKLDQQFLAVMMCGQEQKCIPQDNQPSCGDGKCDTGETTTSCPADCKPATKCGDAKCDPGETTTNCPADCATTSGNCGDLTCTSPENSGTCPLDCDPNAQQMVGCATEMCSSQTTACAADKACLGALNCVFKCGGPSSSCLSQCASALPSATQSVFMTLVSCVQSKCSSTGAVCGNGSCESGETTTSCPSDCKSGPMCGNGSCESGETPSSCPSDCQSGPVCGNGSCESGETSTSCPSDCKATATCGDGVCAAGEQNSCAKDCTNSGKSGGCVAGAPGAKGCAGCLCEQCVCFVGNSSTGAAGDDYCCTTAWDAQCATECTACPTSGCTVP